MLCQTILDELDRIPGDARTMIGFITFDRTIHFYNLTEGLSRPQMLVVGDLEGMTQEIIIGHSILESRPWSLFLSYSCLVVTSHL